MLDTCCLAIGCTRHLTSDLVHKYVHKPPHLYKTEFQYMCRVRYVVHELCHKAKLQILLCVRNWVLMGVCNLGMWDAVMEFAETMAFIGLQIDLVLYLMDKLNFANTKAATTVTNFAGTAFICPLIGGFIADAYLGRFFTILVFGLIELVVSCLFCPSWFIVYNIAKNCTSIFFFSTLLLSEVIINERIFGKLGNTAFG